MKSLRQLIMIPAGIAALLLVNQTAHAVAVVYTIDNGNLALTGYPTPFGTATVDLTSATQATVTFQGNVVGGYTYLFGSEDVMAVNVNAASWNVTNLTLSGTTQLGTSADLSSSGAGNVGSFGTFNQTFLNFDGYQHSASTMSFVLTNLSGTWGSSSSVLADNASGYSVAAHVFVTLDGGATNTGVTGFATTGGGESNVPDQGSTLTLLGSALMGLGWMARRRRA